MYNFKFITSEANLLNRLMSPTTIKMSYCHIRIFRFRITFSPLPWQSIQAQDHQRCFGYILKHYSTFIFCYYLEFDASQVKRQIF